VGTVSRKEAEERAVEAMARGVFFFKVKAGGPLFHLRRRRMHV